jgi:hypothetical protein
MRRTSLARGGSGARGRGSIGWQVRVGTVTTGTSDDDNPPGWGQKPPPKANAENRRSRTMGAVCLQRGRMHACINVGG